MKIKFSQLLDTPLKQGGFSLASKTLSIGEKAERIAKQAREKQIDEGEFAKFHASNIEDWMGQIVKMTEVALDDLLERDAVETHGDR